MSLTLSSNQQTQIDKDNRLTASAGYPMSEIISDLQQTVNGGALGITADAGDIDSLALGGGHFSRDPQNDNGLTFALKAGRIYNGKVVIAVAPSAVLLSPSVINYVEVSRAGVVSKNTVGWTSGSMPLYSVLAGAAGFTVANVTNSKSFFKLIPNGGITGDMLSQAASTKGEQFFVASVAATTTLPIGFMPGTGGTISKLAVAVTTAIAQSDTDYWSFALVDAGAAGTGNTALLAAGAPNTTQLTGGSALVANVARTLTLTTTAANLSAGAGDVLLLTLTKTGNPAALTNLLVRVEFTFSN